MLERAAEEKAKRIADGKAKREAEDNAKAAEAAHELKNKQALELAKKRALEQCDDAIDGDGSGASKVEVKGRDQREKVFANVERFLRVRQSMGAELPYAHIAFVVQPDNAHEALAFRDHWSGLLKQLGRPHRVCYDWPHEDQDALYYRPLNSGDQVASDALHAQVCQELGIAPSDAQRLRAAGSF